MDPVVEKNLRNVGINKIAGVDEAGRGCERPDAEVLTRRGWLNYTELLEGDEVLSYSDNGNIFWQTIDDVIEKDYAGDLIRLYNRSVDIVVTPEHNFTVLVRKSKRIKELNNKEIVVGYRVKYKNVKDLVDNDYIPSGGKWVGKFEDFFSLPGIQRKNGFRKTDLLPIKKIDIKKWAAFMGLYVSEGCCTKDDNGNYKVIISQMRYSKHFEDIKNLLDSLSFNFNYSSHNFTCCNKQLFSYLKNLGNVYNKHLPIDFKDYTPDVLNEFLMWAVKGDGTKEHRKGRQEFYRYYSSSIKLIDDIQEILLKAGWTFSCIIKSKAGSSGGCINGREIVSKVDNYCLTFRRSDKVMVKHLKKENIPYSGKVFCLSLPLYHNFCVRRNGRNYFTGNSLAGIVSVSCVMLPPNHKIEGLNDSKKLSPKKRIELAELIRERAIEIHLARANHAVIDKINILEATKLCIVQVIDKFSVRPDIVVIDGTFNFQKDLYPVFPCQTIINGDNLSENIAAASILAKVFRDNWMDEQHKLYPEYGFINHHGYGTKEHVAAIKKYGPCPIHRRTFNPLRTMLRKGIVKECI